MKHSGHLRTLEKCRKHSPVARVFYISFVFSKDNRVLSRCNTRLRLLYLLTSVLQKHTLLETKMAKIDNLILTKAAIKLNPLGPQIPI